MKLLFDENLSDRLAQLLQDLYTGSDHVRNVGLKEAPDTEVWAFAKTHGFTIVSKDSDFHQRSLVLGHPPKVIWVKLGNCSTRSVERLLRDRATDLEQFEKDSIATFLILS